MYYKKYLYAVLYLILLVHQQFINISFKPAGVPLKGLLASELTRGKFTCNLPMWDCGWWVVRVRWVVCRTTIYIWIIVRRPQCSQHTKKTGCYQYPVLTTNQPTQPPDISETKSVLPSCKVVSRTFHTMRHFNPKIISLEKLYLLNLPDSINVNWPQVLISIRLI